MRSFAKSIAVAAFGLTAAASAASAALIDFTNLSTLSGATGSVDGVGFTVIATGGNLTKNGGSGPGPIDGLLGTGDGLGVGDDEIGPDQYITIIFDQAVKLTGASFLDLFRSAGLDAEEAFVYSGTPPAGGSIVASLTATEVFAPGGAGYGAVAFSSTGTTFSFNAGLGNDDEEVGDVALAALTFEKFPMEVVPLPASALLLGTALWGFAFARRRKL